MKKDAFKCLKGCRRHLSRQQYKTLMGQVKAGDINGAMKGLDHILSRQEKGETK